MESMKRRLIPRSKDRGEEMDIEESRFHCPPPNGLNLSKKQKIALISVLTIAFVALCIFLVVAFVYTQGGRQQDADLLVVNSRIWTGNKDENGKFIWAESFAVKNGKIVQVGSSSQVKKSWKSKEIIDGNSSSHKMIVPGFADSHIHILAGGFSLTSVQLRTAASKEDFVERIKVFAEGMKDKTAWILEGNWNHELWGGELPTRQWIDGATGTHPAFICRLDGHMCLANSLALQISNVTKDTPDVEGGVIVRDSDGNPTGILKDNAMDYIWEFVPEPSLEQNLDALREGMNYLASNGITVVHHMGNFGDLKVFQTARKNNSLITKIHAAVHLSTWERLEKKVREEGKGDQWLSFGSLKAFADGSFGSETAYMWERYGKNNGTGITVDSNPQLTKWLVAADAVGLQSSIHAIGDRANSILLDSCEAMIKANGKRDRRYRIEHAQNLKKEDVIRMKDMDVIGSMQPYHLIDDGCWVEDLVGHQIAQRMFPFREMLDSGISIAFGSDWSVAPPIPLMGIFAAVTRSTLDGKHPDGWIPEQKITVEESLVAYTQKAAHAAFRENWEGKIQEGLSADFVLINQDITQIPPQEIQNAKVLQTFVEGRSVYSS